ncbi:uncharacterized protein BDZ99DRAFT_459602 [Mytilinidion resinicola]|uniref:Thioesterase domain-containing protein n=1 Tax=Mytilinidion resinicola TaxID=574789 RepID=A0A6A6YZC3_9PEZI|nr:uncharacterized protein BDZ99DRAFT_459602 [Mytilinidion resinicola]KAF2813849.1 hypothetical protein BDZ99DRAFT_459602 [Mytilinidion resinicola]
MTSASELRFSRIPWAADLIRDPDWVVCATSSRTPKTSTEDSFFAVTLNTDRTITNLLSLHLKPDENADPPIQAVRTIMDLGTGVNGHPDVCHGGFVATMMDEVMGVLLTINLERASIWKRGEPTIGLFTAYIKVNYKRPVPTPSVVLATARFEKKEGKKAWVVGTIEDGMGVVYATGEALFVQPKGKL